ncbi:MAG: hypothetical protein ABIQ99_08700 [Thermoflexales bacterium]
MPSATRLTTAANGPPAYQLPTTVIAAKAAIQCKSLRHLCRNVHGLVYWIAAFAAMTVDAGQVDAGLAILSILYIDV